MAVDKRNIEVLDDKMTEVLKAIKPQQRLAIAFNLWSSAKRQLTNYLRTEHPDWDEKKVQAEIVRRLSHGAI